MWITFPLIKRKKNPLKASLQAGRLFEEIYEDFSFMIPNAPCETFSYSPKSAFLRAAGFIALISSILFLTASRFGVFFE